MRRRSAISKTLITISVLVAVIMAVLIIYNEDPIQKGEPTLYIPSSDRDDIIRVMNSNGYNFNLFDRFVMDYIHLPKEGWYRFDGNEVGRFLFIKNLYKKREKTINIVVFAGDTNEEMCRRLANDLDLNQSKLEEYYSIYGIFKEGNMLAGRYTLATSVSEKIAIRYLLNRSYKELEFFAKDRFGMDFSLKELKEAIIIASIIQKESNDIKEMSYISSVIKNRLKKNMRLQMDGTLNYGKYVRTIVTSQRIKNDTSRYNTYKHYGLPPEPLSIISMDALEASTFPRQNNYLFFVLNKEGKHTFANTYKEHLANVRVFKAYLRERKELEQELALEEKKKSEVVQGDENKSVSSTKENNESVKS